MGTSHYAQGEAPVWQIELAGGCDAVEPSAVGQGIDNFVDTADDAGPEAGAD